MNSNPLPDLRDVTLCAVDTINPELAARALDISMSQCRFGDAVLFTHEAAPTRARIVLIDRIRSLEAYSAFMLKRIVEHITTPWVLVVQWDGYVVDAAQWTDTFRQYDYIGARWAGYHDGMDVGNGGFSLRSTRLLRALADERFDVPSDACEDMLIGRTWRPLLETAFGIRFAPADLADRFAYEAPYPDRPTFGFHGPFNMWRYVDDETMLDIIRRLDLKTLAGLGCLSALKNFCDLGKLAYVKAIHERYRKHWSAQDVMDAFVRNGLHEDVARHCVHICECSLK